MATLNRIYTVAWLAALGYVFLTMFISGHSPQERGTGFLILLGLVAFRFAVRLPKPSARLR